MSEELDFEDDLEDFDEEDVSTKPEAPVSVSDNISETSLETAQGSGTTAAPAVNMASVQNPGSTADAVPETKGTVFERKADDVKASQAAVNNVNAFGKSASEGKEESSDTEPQKRPFSNKKKRFGESRLAFWKPEEEFSRDDWILTRIRDEDLMEYLTMEYQKNEMLQKAKEVREKRLFTAFQITVALAAVVSVVFLLRDNPMVLINILYILGILIAVWIWRNPRER